MNGSAYGDMTSIDSADMRKMDRHTKEQRQKICRAVKSSGTKLESLLKVKLDELSIDYKEQYAEIIGKPDFYLPGHGVTVIFVEVYIVCALGIRK